MARKIGRIAGRTFIIPVHGISKHMMYDQKSDEKLMCLKSPEGIRTVSRTFDRLESKLHSLKGRRFFGLSKEEEGEEVYFACTRIEPEDDPEKLGFQRLAIEKGKYDRELFSDWEKKWDGQNIEGLPELFQAMHTRNSGNIDGKRFTVEYYRSQRELYVMLPIR